MVERNTLKARSRAAALFNAWLTSPGEFGEAQEHYLSLFDDNVIALAAGPDESAALTIHRMESLGAERVILTTSWGPTHLFVGNFDIRPDSNDVRVRDVPGELTVREWAETMTAGTSYSANGSEFASVIDSCTPDMAMV